MERGRFGGVQYNPVVPVQRLHYIGAVPRLKRFSSTEIAMFFADHPPPHFHVLGREGAAQVRIDTLEVIAMSGRIDLRRRWTGRPTTVRSSRRSGRS
jgi:hypothetical protein